MSSVVGDHVDSGHMRTYRALLRCYPPAFRTRFADEMVQLFGDQFGDQLDACRTRNEAAGTIRMWLRTIWDLIVTAPGEHRRDRTMAHSLSAPPTAATRTLGILGVVGGSILLVAFLPFAVVPQALNWIRLLLFCLGAMAIVAAVHRRQVHASPALAWSAAIPAFIANGWYVAMVLLSLLSDRPFAGEFGLVWFLAGLSMWAADGWFGIVTFKLGVVSRWGSLALILGTLSIIGMDRFGLVRGLDPTVFSVLALTGVALNGLGWLLLGVDVATRRRPVTPQPG